MRKTAIRNMKGYFAAATMALLTAITAMGQQTGDKIQREVRLYNPFRPTLSEATKKSYFPDMTDTATVSHAFTYSVNPEPFTPPYVISTIRPATILPDPLVRLYKSYLNLGIGNYFTPFGELSIATERSKTGMLAFYARHFSSNGTLKLENLEKVYAGYMDNEAVMYGKKFFRNSILSGSVGFSHLMRHAYGYDTLIAWSPEKEDIRLAFMNAGADASFSSLRSDSGLLVYDFSAGYNMFRQSADLWQHTVSFDADAGKSIRALGPSKAARRAGVSDFYGRLRAAYDLSLFNAAITDRPRHIITINPSLSKRSNEWSFRLGAAAVTESRYFTGTMGDEYGTRFHVYPDIDFSLSVIPSFLVFNLGLEGGLEDNSAPEMVQINPFLVTDGSLFTLPYTDKQIVASAGFSGGSIPSTSYRITGSYSVFREMPFLSNNIWSDLVVNEGVGNHFIPVVSDGNLANVNGEVTTVITRTISATARADYYHYSLTGIDHPYNKPSWEGSVKVKYNLRDKILAGATLNAIGQRKALVTMLPLAGPPVTTRTIDLPAHVSLNLTGEYRYTKILSFWVKMNNISFNRYYEWAFYPSQRFLFMAGFSYSL